MTAHCRGDRLLASPAMWSCKAAAELVRGEADAQKLLKPFPYLQFGELTQFLRS